MARPSHHSLWTALFCGALLAPSFSGAATGRSLGLVPSPRVESVRLGSVQLGADWQIIAPSDPADLYAAALLGEESRACFNWAWRVVPSRSSARSVELL